MKKDKKIFSKATKFSLGIAVITFVLAAIFSIVSTYMLGDVMWAVGMLVVFALVGIGVFFDMLGIASAAASEVPFHAMAAEKVKGAKHAILITRNADRFSSFCNDVIGDITGIVSGTASALVVLQFTLQLGFREDSTPQFIIAVVFTAIVAALTVGGKAFGKSLAIHYSTEIIYRVGMIFYFFEEKLNITFIKEAPKKKSTKKK